MGAISSEGDISYAWPSGHLFFLRLTWSLPRCQFHAIVWFGKCEEMRRMFVYILFMYIIAVLSSGSTGHQFSPQGTQSGNGYFLANIPS